MQYLVRESGVLVAPRPLLEELTGQMRASEETIQDVSNDLRAGEVEDLPDRVGTVTRSLEHQMRLMGWLERDLFLRLVATAGSSQSEAAEERLMLQVRQLGRRYRARIGKSLRSLKGGLEANRLESRSASADLQQILYVHRAIREVLEETLRSADEEPTADPVQVPEFYETSRAHRRTLWKLAGGEGGAELARAFIAGRPEAAVVLLLAKEHLVEEAAESLAAARKSVGRSDPAMAAYRRNLRIVRRSIGDFKTAVEWAGEGRLREKLSRHARVLLNRLETLQPAEEALEKEDVSRLRYGIGQAVEELEALQRELERVARSPREGLCRFRGGPTGIWASPFGVHARRSQDRLKRQAEFARQRSTLAILAAIEDGRPERFAAGYGWAEFLYRLARSELCLAGPKAGAGQGETEERNPHIAFLTAELQKALKADRPQNYADLTERYLRAVEDYLRY
jgi:hypothetical protein